VTTESYVQPLPKGRKGIRWRWTCGCGETWQAFLSEEKAALDHARHLRHDGCSEAEKLRGNA
jgi:hypothetical protein